MVVTVDSPIPDDVVARDPRPRRFQDGRAVTL